MTSFARRLTSALALFLAVPVGSVAADETASSYPQEAALLLEQARALGARVLSDKKAKKEAKESLNQAEELLAKAARKDKTCEKCVESLAAARYLQAYYDLEGDYDDVLKTVKQGLELFPGNADLAYFQGTALHAKQDFGGASRAFNRYLMTAAGSSAAESQARTLLADSQQKFLGGWYEQADFFQSNDSRLLQLNPQTNQWQVLMQFTPESERQLGEYSFQQLAASSRTMAEPAIEGYVQGVVKRLVESTPIQGFDYRVTIVDSPEVNAMTPPGHIIVYTGLLGFAESEAELAGVLAHELAHNYGHHAARRYLKAASAQLLATTLTNALNPQGTWAQIATNLGANLGVMLFVNAYNRSEEKEADLYGAHLLFNAGYSPTSLSGFFVKLYKEHPKQPMKLLSTHPPLPDRADYLSDYIEAFPLDREFKLDSEEFKAMKQRLRVISPGVVRGPANAAAPVLPVLP